MRVIQIITIVFVLALIACNNDQKDKPRPSIKSIAHTTSNDPCQVYSTINLVLTDVFIEASLVDLRRTPNSERMKEGLSAANQLAIKMNDSELSDKLTGLHNRVPFGILDPSWEFVENYVHTRVEHECGTPD